MKNSYTLTPQNIELVIPSKLSYVDDILQLVERQLEDGGFSQPFIDDIWIGLREAIISAIRYGNKNDPKKKVVIHACITNNFAKFKISDEGNECSCALMPDSKEMADFL